MQRSVLFLLIAVIGLAAFLLLVEGPEPITVQVKNLQVEQNGFDLNITWDEMDCDGYDLVITQDNQRTAVNTPDNSYTVKDIVLEKNYRIKVNARLKSGHKSRSAKAEILTRKLPQDLTVDIESYDGFKGDSFRVKAKGTGDITFSSGNSKTAKVNKKGLVKLKNTGKTEIRVSAAGDALYADGEVTIPVNVYPEELTRPVNLKAKNVSDTRCELTWDRVGFASHYKIYRQNVHTKKYEHYRDTDTEETSIEITRDAGTYSVVAFNEIQDKTIKSPHAKSVQVQGTTEIANVYSSARTIKKLNSSNLTLLREINGDGETRTPQSLSQKDDCYVISYVNMSGTAGKIVSYRKSDVECVEIVPAEGMGHANGTTYNPNTNKFYMAKTHKGYKTASCSTYDGTTKKSTGTITLPRKTSGIAYDESNDCFYLSKGNEIYVCDSDFTVQKFIHKKARYNHAQDIGAYNGVVLVCTWVNGNTSYIDLYRVSDKAYLGSYDVSIGEIESCVVDDGYLVILMNMRGTSTDRLYKTKERIAIP